MGAVVTLTSSPINAASDSPQTPDPVTTAGAAERPAAGDARMAKAPAGTRAEDSTAHTARSKVRRLGMFKNGFAYVVREVELPGGTTESVLEQLPVPVLGTFWVVPPPNTSLQSVVARPQSRLEKTSAGTLPELLRANLGEKLEVKTADGWLSGKLVSVSGDRAPVTVEEPSPLERYSARPSRSVNPPQASDLILLETDAGLTALPLTAVSQVRRKGGADALKTTLERPVPGGSLAIQSSGSGGKAEVAWLTRGLTWTPSYRLDLAPKSARLQGRATLINDAEDMQIEELNCIVGFPNVRFSALTDPLALTQTMEQLLSSLEGGNTSRRSRPGVITQQAVMSNIGRFGDDSEAPAEAPPVAGEGGDLHYYTFKDVQLQKGERISLSMLEQDLPYTELYRWTSSDDSDPSYRFAEGSGNRAETQEIWHAVSLRNGGKLPWTTAPIMVSRGTSFLGQDMMTYTPVGARTLVNITKALDVKGKLEESTVEIRPTPEKILRENYRAFIIAGRLEVTSFKGEPIKVLIERRITGALLEQSIKPTQITEEPRQDVANGRATVTWELEVPPGKSAAITYKYKLLLR